MPHNDLQRKSGDVVNIGEPVNQNEDTIAGFDKDEVHSFLDEKNISEAEFVDRFGGKDPGPTGPTGAVKGGQTGGTIFGDNQPDIGANVEGITDAINRAAEESIARLTQGAERAVQETASQFTGRGLRRSGLAAGAVDETNKRLQRQQEKIETERLKNLGQLGRQAVRDRAQFALQRHRSNLQQETNEHQIMAQQAANQRGEQQADVQAFPAGPGRTTRGTPPGRSGGIGNALEGFDFGLGGDRGGSGVDQAGGGILEGVEFSNPSDPNTGDRPLTESDLDEEETLSERIRRINQ